MRLITLILDSSADSGTQRKMDGRSLLLKRFGELKHDDDEESSKRIKTAMCAVIVATVINKVTLHYTVPNRLPPTVRDRSPLVTKILALQDSGLFKRMYRLDYRDFQHALVCITPLMQKRVLTTSIPMIVKLAVALRFLAGAIYLDLSFGYDIDHNNIHHVIFDTIKAIDDCKDPFLDNIRFPTNRVDLMTVEAGFSRLSGNRLRGTASAGDGVVFRMFAPLPWEVNADVVSWYVRKGYYAYGLQAFCDSATKFLFISSKLCSSAHDSAQYAVSALSKFIKDKKLLPGFHVVLDDAYICCDQELSPWKGRSLSVEKDAFNYYLSLHRQCIERAFGILVSRWGIFWRPLKVSMEHRAMVIRVCCKLHNICVDRFGVENPPVMTRRNASRDIDVQYGDAAVAEFSDEFVIRAGYRSDLEISTDRDTLTQVLKDGNVERPQHSKHSRVRRS